MTAETKRKRAEVIAKFREELDNLRALDQSRVAPLTQRVQKMVEHRKSVRPTSIEEEQVAS